MRELNVSEIDCISGGNDHPNNAWNSDDSLSATVTRHAGLGAIGGSLGGPKGALVGAAVGAFSGFMEYYG